jgi:hypothetical protein
MKEIEPPKVGVKKVGVDSVTGFPLVEPDEREIAEVVAGKEHDE